MQHLQNCIGPTIRIGGEIRCLPYAGFFVMNSILHSVFNGPSVAGAGLQPALLITD